ncbi:adenosylhomocysteine nucleosidase [Acinetobacter calcoaceticus]|uniref:Adenosylhomocysteine nucleosidase n=1 Tax=Acinetobacter calcoaceticus TaxID=471 RepID=A0A4R1XK33_ACICA|nr:adenosylhomocysteine nucleosidase [Acinetobacter calcoaceticus]
MSKNILKNNQESVMQIKKVISTIIFITAPSLALYGCRFDSSNKSQTIAYSNYLTDNSPRLGIIAAFGQEADLLISSTEDKKQYIINGRKFVTGQLEKTSVVITISGISMTNAAMTTQMMADHFQLKGIVFSGIAGSLNPKLNIGDVVIAQNWIAPNEVYYANDSELPAACGQAGDISCLGLKLDLTTPPYQTQYLRQTNVINEKNYNNIALSTQIDGVDSPIAFGEMKTDFAVDAKMLAIAKNSAPTTQTQLESICQNKNTCYQPQIVFSQRGVSGGAFLANTDYRDYLHKTLSGDVVDMETTAVAQVAYANNIPFIAFRSLSDLAGADHDPNVAVFFGSGIAQRNAAKLTMAFVQQWHLE